MKRNAYKASIPIVSGIAYVANPKKVPDVPIEATVRSERIGTKTRELTPGVHVVAQISRTGKEVWLTQGEQRLFLYLQDDQGRGSLFYQSFAGTGGKQQGFWFPSGGILADQRGRGVWVIKGNPKTDPGAGREGLLALYEKANAVLPQSDAETEAFVKKATRVDYDDLMYKDEYEIKPTMKILEEGHANALQSKWATWAYRFWALNALDKTWGKRTFNIKENPRDLAGRHVPDRYLAGLPTALQKQRIGELTQSRDDYKLGDYSELPTDRIARKMGLVKQSQYTTEAKIRGIEYRGDLRDMAKRVMVFYGHRATSGEVQQFADALRKSFAKGLAAWKSGGHRPGATAQNWAVARVNSLVVGGKTSWTADKKLFEVLPAAVRAKIEAMRAKQNPLRRNPVEDKQEQQEVWKLLGLGKGKQRKLERQAERKLEELKTDPKLAEDLVSEALLHAATYIFRLADYSDIVADLDRWSSEFWRVAERYVETNAHLAAEHSHASPPARRVAERIKQQAASLTRLTGTKPTLAELSKSLAPVKGVGMSPDQIRTAVAAGRPPILLGIDTLSHKDRQRMQLPEAAAPYQTDAEQLQEQKNLAAFAQAQLSETEKKVLERSLSDNPNWAQLGLTVSEGKYRAAAAVMKLRNTVKALQAHNVAQARVLELSDVAKVYADSSPRRIILTADGEEMDVQDLRDELRRAQDRSAKAEVRLLTTSGNTNILDQWEAEKRRLEAREAVLIEAVPEGVRGRW